MNKPVSTDLLINNIKDFFAKQKNVKKLIEYRKFIQFER